MHNVTDIHIAAHEDDTARLERLIADGGNVNATDEEGGTPLHYASKAGCLQAASLLLRHGATVNATTTKGYTPLMLAAAGNFVDVARLLLEMGANAALRSTKGFTAREIAAGRKHTDVAALLPPASPGSTTLAPSQFSPPNVDLRIMSTVTPRQVGKVAGKLLHERLTQAGIVNSLHSRIMATMPTVVQEAGADSTGSKLAAMFQATAGQYAMCFGYARLAVRASTLFTKRVLGLFPLPDKAAWAEFTEGVLEYATDSMRHPATRVDIIDDINDQQNAVARFCRHYPPEAAAVLRATADEIDRSVSDVLAGFNK